MKNSRDSGVCDSAGLALLNHTPSAMHSTTAAHHNNTKGFQLGRGCDL